MTHLSLFIYQYNTFPYTLDTLDVGLKVYYFKFLNSILMCCNCDGILIIIILLSTVHSCMRIFIFSTTTGQTYIEFISGYEMKK